MISKMIRDKINLHLSSTLERLTEAERCMLERPIQWLAVDCCGDCPFVRQIDDDLGFWASCAHDASKRLEIKLNVATLFSGPMPDLCPLKTQSMLIYANEEESEPGGDDGSE